ncbi:hypothetical protein [Caulobacter hibisci]|uniref:Uncharacterized protein n=1 Tax=Caulobacter hibisci TaxID=2035993 RepID=A0ABS0T7H0_9CAUL|nr:hypothetical protein [Caulobacter hibisci]MBI1686833.1 hypothetical protein [Caulobacter hibisci]
MPWILDALGAHRLVRLLVVMALVVCAVVFVVRDVHVYVPASYGDPLCIGLIVAAAIGAIRNIVDAARSEHLKLWG